MNVFLHLKQRGITVNMHIAKINLPVLKIGQVWTKLTILKITQLANYGNTQLANYGKYRTFQFWKLIESKIGQFWKV